MTKFPRKTPPDSSHEGGGVQDIFHKNTNVSPIGIDTARLHVDDFSVEDDAGFTIFEQSDHSTGELQSVPLWIDSEGTVVTGDRATLNTSFFQVTVQSVDFMTVQASLPKLLHGNNVRPVSTSAGIRRALKVLDDRLTQQGIDCSLSGRPLARADICRNVRTETPIRDLKPLLKRLRAPHLKPRDNGHEGVKWISLQGRRSDREITFYSKSKEAGLSDPHIQRFEYRLQRKRAVESKLDGSDIDDLCQSLACVRTAFREIVRELFPEYNDGEGTTDSVGDSGEETSGEQITSDQIRHLLREIRSEHGENCHAINRLTWPLLLAIHPDPNRLTDALERAAASEDGPTRGKYQVRRKARQARSHARRLSSEMKTSHERLQTLRTKLLS